MQNIPVAFYLFDSQWKICLVYPPKRWKRSSKKEKERMTVLKTHFATSVFFICFYIFQGLFNFRVIFVKIKTPDCKNKQATLNDCHPANHSGLLCRPSAGEAQTCKRSEEGQEGLTHCLLSLSSNSRKKKDSGQESLHAQHLQSSCLLSHARTMAAATFPGPRDIV